MKKKIIETTRYNNWYSQNEVLQLELNSEQHKVKTIAMSSNKRILIFGSSVAEGWGAINLNGWAKLLADRLADRGWEIINRAIGGNNSNDLLSRIYSDVIPENPNIVIISVSLGNESIFDDDKDKIYLQFITNIKKMIFILQQHDIQVIITNVYPHKDYSAVEYQYVQNMNLEIDRLNVATINVCGTIDNLSGNWIDGLYADSAHPNDFGYIEMESAFSPSLFDNMTSNDYRIAKMQNDQFFAVNNNSNYALKVFVDGEMRSFTLSLSFIANRHHGELITIGNSFSVHFSKNKLVFIYDENVIQEIVTNIHLVRKTLVLTYHPFIEELDVYLDGIHRFTINNIQISASDLIIHCENVSLKEILLYRGRLNDNQIIMLSNKYVFKSSLEIYSPLYEPILGLGQFLMNLSPTNSYFKIVSQK